jgi:hypothetical protein
MSASSIWETVTAAVRLWVRPIRKAGAVGPIGIAKLIADATGNAATTDIASALGDAATALTSIVDDSSTPPDDPQSALGSLGGIIAAVESLQRALSPDAARAVFEFLTLRALFEGAPKVYTTLAFIGVIDEVRPGGQRLQWDQLQHLYEPGNLMRDVYKWGQPEFDGSALLGRVADLASAFGAPITFGILHPAFVAAIDPSLSNDQPPLALLPLFEREQVFLGLGAAMVSGGSDLANAGIALLPAGFANFEAGALSDTWNLSIDATSGGGDGYGVALRPSGVSVVSPSGEAGGPSLELKLSRSPDKPWAMDLGSGFALGAESVELAVNYVLSASPDFGAKFRVDKFAVKITPEPDGLLSKVLPPGGLQSSGDFTIGWSKQKGFYFQGGLGFATTIALHANLGPLSLEELDLAAFLSPSPILSVEARLNVSATLGPIQAAIAGIGVRGVLDLADAGDTSSDSTRFGPVKASIAFVWPDGLGVVVHGGAVNGGGFARRDEATGTYSGILDLKFGEIGLVAIAIVTTKLPDGKPGYAFFINIGVTFSPPITLPYNFNLRGCGGLLALNRTMDVEALRSGLKTHTLDSILFPEDPILNANKIIADSERVFPIEEGRFVVGPMAKLGWGADGLIVADIAVVIELPAPIIIAVLGQITATVPNPKQAKVIIHLDVLGVLDVAKKSLSIDATLYDSKIITYDLSGDMALRLVWGSQPMFGMSLGGWHPKFTPPPNFPKLQRLTLQLSSSSSFQLSCHAYQALTSNTFQFGADIELYAKACGATLDGGLSFDTLIIFSPFEFEVDISGHVSAKYHGHHIASVSLSVDLSGPTPWHAKGKARVSVLCFHVTARFNKTWGSEDKAIAPQIDPRCPFLVEVQSVANWNGALLPRRTAVESLKSLEPAAGVTPPDLIAHPAGAIEVRQRLLPLGLPLEKFANADVTGHSQFDIELALGPQAATNQPATTNLPAVDNVPVEEYFARGQFKNLSKDERLSKPSYEPFKAGARVGPAQPRLDGPSEYCALEFESILIKADGAKDTPKATTADWGALKRSLRIAALRRAGLRRRGLGKFTSAGASRVGVKSEGYTVVDATTLAPASGITSPTGSLTQTAAEDLVSTATAAGQVGQSAVMVVPDAEVGAAV